MFDDIFDTKEELERRKKETEKRRIEELNQQHHEEGMKIFRKKMKSGGAGKNPFGKGD